MTTVAFPTKEKYSEIWAARPGNIIIPVWFWVYQVRHLKPLRKTIESYTGKERVITVELLDGSTVKGRVVSAEPDTFTLRDPESAQEIRLHYDHLKTFDKEPAGQRIVRNAMIGAGVGLGAIVILLAALITD